MKTVMKKLVAAVLVAAFAGFAWRSLPSPEQAQAPGTTQATVSGSGVVQDVELQGGMVTIRHGPLPALNMMAMTMSYAVKDRSQMGDLKVDQRVQFQVIQNGGEYLITDIK
jgi:Cu(I)/Ag(I) efflux system periplasmic protein CusF